MAIRTSYTSEFGWQGQTVQLSRDDPVPSEGELRAAVKAGAGVWLRGGETRRDFSFKLLLPVIEELPALFVESRDNMLDTEVLEGAAALSMLRWHGRTGQPADFSRLPALRGFSGHLSRITKSVLANPGLTRVEIEGAIPAAVSRVAGPLERFIHIGARRATTLPEFASPDSLLEFLRSGVDGFDLNQLTQFSRLKRVDISDAVVSGVAALASLPNLERLTIQDVQSVEGWDGLPSKLDGFAFGLLRPLLRAATIARLSEGGWSITQREPTVGPYAPFTVEPIEGEGLLSGWNWAVYLEDFSALKTADGDDDFGRLNGPELEPVIERIIDDIAATAPRIDVMFDSEGDLFAAYFRSERDAITVAEAARVSLAE